MGANQGRPAKPESQGKGYHQHPRLHATANGIINKAVPVPGNVINAGTKVLVNGQQSGSYDVTIVSPSNENGVQRGNFLVPINSVDIMQPSRQQEDLNRYLWFHAGINREEAKILLDSGVDGSFLIRNSETQAGHFSISLRAHEVREGASKDTIYHYRIQYVDGLYHITPNHRFKFLSDLVEHHRQNPDGLITTLRCPVVRRTQSSSDSSRDEWEIDRKLVSTECRLGSGQYGDVYRGTYSPRDGSPPIAVAMKTLRDDNQVSDDFLKEMAVMKKLRHRNLLPLIGVVSLDKPYLLITEFMNQGSLLDFIKNANPMTVNHIVQLRIVLQICDAMKYLERENFIHRDLAARNCLVKSDDAGSNSDSFSPLVKVADFGLSRLVDPDEIYTASQGKKFPIKWTAPEGISHKRFSVKSDVWSFGVLFWEVSSYGLQPYPGIDIANVFAMLENGKRLEKPDNCPRDSYDLMKKCWLWEADHRPSFSSLFERLIQLIDREKRSNCAPVLPDYRNHPSMRETPSQGSSQFSPNLNRNQPSRPTSRPLVLTSHNSASQIRERPHTAMGTLHEQPFSRNEPKRKSAGLLSRLKGGFSFGKGKSKKSRPAQNHQQSMITSSQEKGGVHNPHGYQHQPNMNSAVPKFSSHITPVNHHSRQKHHHASYLSQHEEPIPDFWLSGKQPPNHSRELAKPVPLKPPRRSRSRSKSGSGSCSSPSSQPPLALPLPQAHSSLFYDTHNFNLSELGSPQVVELTPTNSQEKICETSSQSDFSSLNSGGGHVQYQKRPHRKPPVPPQEIMQPHDRITDLSVVHGRSPYSDSNTVAEEGFAKDVQTLLCLQTRLVESLSSSINKDKKSVVLSYGQRLCDFGQRLLEADPCFLPLKTKFKFSEKLSSVKSEVSAILSNQTKDGTRLTRYSQELVNLVK